MPMTEQNLEKRQIHPSEISLLRDTEKQREKNYFEKNLSQQGTGSAILYQIAYDNLEIVSETSWRNLRHPQSILEGLRQINKKAESVSEHLDAVLGPCPSILEHLRNCHGLLRNCLGITSGLLGIAQGFLRDCLGIAKHCLGIAQGLPWDCWGLLRDCLGIALRLLRIAQGLLRDCLGIAKHCLGIAKGLP